MEQWISRAIDSTEKAALRSNALMLHSPEADDPPEFSLVELDVIFPAHPFLDETLGVRVDLERLLDGFFEPVAAQ